MTHLYSGRCRRHSHVESNRHLFIYIRPRGIHVRKLIVYTAPIGHLGHAVGNVRRVWRFSPPLKLHRCLQNHPQTSTKCFNTVAGNTYINLKPSKPGSFWSHTILNLVTTHIEKQTRKSVCSQVKSRSRRWRPTYPTHGFSKIQNIYHQITSNIYIWELQKIFIKGLESIIIL